MQNKEIKEEELKKLRRDVEYTDLQERKLQQERDKTGKFDIHMLPEFRPKSEQEISNIIHNEHFSYLRRDSIFQFYNKTAITVLMVCLAVSDPLYPIVGICAHFLSMALMMIFHSFSVESPRGSIASRFYYWLYNRKNKNDSSLSGNEQLAKNLYFRPRIVLIIVTVLSEIVGFIFLVATLLTFNNIELQILRDNACKVVPWLNVC